MATTIPYDTMSTTSKSDSLFTKCCCCIPLRVGCFILGYLSLIYNCFRTLSTLGVLMFIGISTHGFDHIDSSTDSDYTDEPASDPIWEEIGIILLVILLVNFIWLVVNIACLVGLHKKRPGPIRVYVGFASVRLILALIGFILLVVSGRTTAGTMVAQSIDLGLTAYFVLVYYIYAMQLERELAQRLPGPGPDAVSVNDISFIYPKTLSEKHLIA